MNLNFSLDQNILDIPPSTIFFFLGENVARLAEFEASKLLMGILKCMPPSYVMTLS